MKENLVLNSNDIKELDEDLQQLVELTAVLEASRDALNERAKEVGEKYEEITPAQLKKMASIISKDNRAEEEAKALVIFEVLDALEAEDERDEDTALS